MQQQCTGCAADAVSPPVSRLVSAHCVLPPLFLRHFLAPPHHFAPPTCLLPQEFATSGSNNTDSGKSSGHLETKYKMSDLGLNFTQKWNTDNTLTTEVTMEDQVESRALDCSHHGPKSVTVFNILNLERVFFNGLCAVSFLSWPKA